MIWICTVDERIASFKRENGTHLFEQSFIGNRGFSRTRWSFQIFLISIPTVPGEMIQFDEHILQMGWFNHQLEDFWAMH